MISYEEVVRRNRANPMRPPGWMRRMARLSGEPRRRGLARADWHRPFQDTRKQPGRSFGPVPWGPDVPKKNKVIDKDGNARISPLSADQRLTRYQGQTGRHAARPEEHWPEGLLREDPARRHAALLGLTMRQRRRLVHKANHVTAPFGKREV